LKYKKYAKTLALTSSHGDELYAKNIVIATGCVDDGVSHYVCARPTARIYVIEVNRYKIRNLRH